MADMPILEMSKSCIVEVSVIGDSESLVGVLMFTALKSNIGNISSKEFKPAASKTSIRVITVTISEIIGSIDTSKLFILT